MAAKKGGAGGAMERPVPSTYFMYILVCYKRELIFKAMWSH